MRFVLSTGDFKYANRQRPGFPLILDGAMQPAQPFHGYLRHRLLEGGRLLDVKTWEAYGRRLWDFAMFLHANKLKWDQPSTAPGVSVVSVYRDWQTFDLKLDPSTIQARSMTAWRS